MRVGGRFQVGRDGAIEFLIREDKSSPEALRSVKEQLARSMRHGLSVTAKVPVPSLFSNKDLVSIGFLTAAYLLWFRELGYSWALQDHLEPIREQIRSSTLTTLPKSFGGALRDGFWEEPWVGIGEITGEVALLAGVFDRIIFLPPTDRPDLYARLPQNLDGVQVNGIRAVHLYARHSFEGPVGVVFGDRVLVAPDVLFRRSCPVIFLPPDGSAPEMLYPIEPGHVS